MPCLSWLGGLQLSDSNYVLAITNLERAIELGSTDPDDFLELGARTRRKGAATWASPTCSKGTSQTQNENYEKQSSFANALQTCGVQITGQPAPQATEAGEAEEAASGEADLEATPAP